MVGPSERQTLLHHTAVDEGRRWFETWREELRSQGRQMEGGWPGTIGEARALVSASLGALLARRRLPCATLEELGAAARTTYTEAKRAWLDERRPESTRGV